MKQSKLEFPQLSLTLPILLHQPPQLLVTGGRAPDIAWLKTLCPHCNKLWAADHGVDACRAAGSAPDCWVGDGDSLQAESRRWLKELAIPTQVLPTDKDFTDTQIALNAMTAEQAAYIILTGAFGGRFDHLYSTLFDCSTRPLPCCLIDEQEAVFFVKADMPLTLSCHSRPKALSLIPFTESCHGVTIDNVRWTPDPILRQGFPNAISNELIDPQQPVTIQVAAGILGVYLYWGTH